MTGRLTAVRLKPPAGVLGSGDEIMAPAPPFPQRNLTADFAMTSPGSYPRRDLLLHSAGMLGLAALGGVAVTGPVANAADPEHEDHRVDGNSSRRRAVRVLLEHEQIIREKKIGTVAELEIAAKVGYSAVEPWMRQLEEYVAGGGSLKDLGKRIDSA